MSDYGCLDYGKNSQLRLCRRTLDGIEYLDIRLWIKTIKGTYFPSKKGISLRQEFFQDQLWPLLLDIFNKEGLAQLPQDFADSDKPY